MNEHNTFKEKTCKYCRNFLTVPACFKCRVFTGVSSAPDFSCRSDEENPNYLKMLYALQLVEENGVLVI